MYFGVLSDCFYFVTYFALRTLIDCSSVDPGFVIWYLICQRFGFRRVFCIDGNKFSFSLLTMACLQCTTPINENDQHYVAGDMGPEIISVIQHNLSRQIDENEVMCSHCFVNTMVELTSSSAPAQEDNELQYAHDNNVCVRCRTSLFKRRSHSISEGPERQHIAEAIAPREIPEGGLICYTCWVHVRRILQQQGIEAVPAININICVWCQRSLVQTRSHSLPEGPERNLIAARIYPREIPPGGLVCYACWVSARRNVERAAITEDNQQTPGPSNLHQNSTCAWCSMSLHRRLTHVASGPVRDELAARIYPNELPEHALLCSNCWTHTQENIGMEQEVVQQFNIQPPSESITLDSFTHTTQASAHCFVPACNNQERNRVPEYLRRIILKSEKIFVTENARVCNEHKSVYNWEFLDQLQFSNIFTKNEIESMLRLSVQDDETHQIEFNNISRIDEGLFKFWTGVTKDNFTNILNLISPALTYKYPETALGIYLVKARTGDSHERIASLFHLSKSSITRLLEVAREALLSLFVPLHLGINQTRNDLINRNLLIPEGLFGNREARVPIVICDGTYIYIQKSSNYMFQKKTYSLHKYRNLVKPFLIVATDGYIFDILGPYPATKSDSDIMKALFQNENEGLRAFFQPNDVFILDRGFRDSIAMLEGLGFKVYKPESLEPGETQLSTISANKTRCVTLCRWVVEVVNGRFKRDFKLLRHDFFNLAATHLMDDVRICAALINAFHPVIENRPDANAILTRALQRINMPNQLAELVIANRINRYRAQFTRIDGQLPELSIFPEMTMSDLVLFGLGTYQIKQARSYFGEHIRQHGSFQVEVSDQLEVVAEATPSQLDPLLIRGRIKSRHSSGRTYYTYILLASGGSGWDEKLISYYCSCISGKRTVGCCAHIMAIVWYLGWARYQESIEAPASFLDEILLTLERRKNTLTEKDGEGSNDPST